MTVLFVTHDREEAFSIADRIALMRDGRVVQSGAPEEIYFAPVDRWVAAFAGAGNFLGGELEGTLVTTPIGRFPVESASASRGFEAIARVEVRDEIDAEFRLDLAVDNFDLSGRFVFGDEPSDAKLRSFHLAETRGSKGATPRLPWRDADVAERSQSLRAARSAS